MLRCGQFELSLDRPLIMGIVNLTPDSFSGDGLVSGLANDRASDLANDRANNASAMVEQAVLQAQQQIAAGADLLDLGAESSRPGATPTSLEEELRRLLPVLDALVACGVPISVDTYKPEVMRSALAHGASMINDIYALRRPGALAAVAESDCAVCLMHMQGEPLNMQQNPQYSDVCRDVQAFLAERVNAALAAGISAARLVLDPGFGFGKSLEHNIALFRGFCSRDDSSPLFVDRGLPWLAGISRKSMLGAMTGRDVDQRLVGSVTAALLAAQGGARILRVHDVAETKDALSVWQALSSKN